jgi:uncharacterized membrane protein SirB2
MNLYPAVKHLHMACVTLSIAGFVFRWLWMLSGRSLPGKGWRRWAPHANDTVLLLAAIALTMMTSQYPVVDAWLTAKIFGLAVYIVLGAIALKLGTATPIRVAAGAVALVAFGYVVSVALTKNPMGFLV